MEGGHCLYRDELKSEEARARVTVKLLLSWKNAAWNDQGSQRTFLSQMGRELWLC